ncbi:50S ribosomal protein L29 [Ferrimicrobium acidiphilum]|uniref:Large ribosomal subunit protein uL29 n=1 Tax=Ferrimicrobium acidiphilum DSM 19497 TaxID=1121877 RepID=A0A0D8FWY2_9ACTN|nr:50S ribosomal protein L29 [Ferrimicrobium acidiphilum DSM 19497]
MSKATEYRDMLDDELRTKLGETKEELFRLRFAIASAQGTDTAKLGLLRKEIARIETVLSERRVAALGGEL